MVERDDYSAGGLFIAKDGNSCILIQRAYAPSYKGTSSKSTKLIHGGVRYLQKAIFELDYEQ